MPLLVFDAVRPVTVRYREPGYDEYARKLMAYNNLWKAKRLDDGNDPRIEIRKQLNNASLKLVVHKDFDQVAMSLNGTAFLSQKELDDIRYAVDEAKRELGQ